jgi:hypothetical protein
MSYPSVTLSSAIEVQAPVNISEISVIQVAEDPQAQTVQAFINFSVGTAWVSVMDASNYRTDWSDQDVSAAIQDWAINTYPQAR